MSLLKKITKLLFAMMIISPVYVFCADPDVGPGPGLPPEPTNEATVNVEVLRQLTCVIKPPVNSASNATDLIIVSGTSRNDTEFPNGRIHPTYRLEITGAFEQAITINFHADSEPEGLMSYSDGTGQVKAIVKWHEGFEGDDHIYVSPWSANLFDPMYDSPAGEYAAFMVIKKVEAVEGTPPGDYTIPVTVSVYYTGF